MPNKVTKYLIPDTAIAHFTIDGEIENSRVFDYFEEQGVEYEATIDGIQTFIQETDEEQNLTLQYEINIIPEESYIRIESNDRINGEYLVALGVEELTPGIFDPDNATVNVTYASSLPHPVVDLKLIDDLIDSVTLQETDTGTQILSYSYDDKEYKITENFEIIPEVPEPESVYECIDRLNRELYEELPEPPDFFQIDELPNGWVSPVIHIHPVLSEELTNYTMEENPLGADEMDIESERTPNDDVVIATDIFTSLFYALDTLTPIEREEYYQSYENNDGFYATVFTKREEDGTEHEMLMEEFKQTRFWTKELHESVLEYRNQYVETKYFAESCDEYDIEEGQFWRMKTANETQILLIEILGKRKLDHLRFDHLPIWVGEVKESHPLVEGVEGVDEGSVITVNCDLLLKRDEQLEE